MYNNKDLSVFVESRNKFNEIFDDVVNDILILKYECNMNITQIHNTTTYQIDFINYVLTMYQLNKMDDMNNYTKSIKITAHNIIR
jgi:hypothetical protein